jgi:hypothetical protein
MTNSTQQNGHMGPKRPRRVNANFIERRRVHQLNERFDQLRQLLPPTGEKQSKVVVLTRCSELIRCQQQVIRDLLLQLDQQQTMLSGPSAYKPLDYMLAGARKNDFGLPNLVPKAPLLTASTGGMETTVMPQATTHLLSAPVPRSSEQKGVERVQPEGDGHDDEDVGGAAGIPVGSPQQSDESITDTESPDTPGADVQAAGTPKIIRYDSTSVSDSSGGLIQAVDTDLAPQASAASALIQLSSSPAAATNLTGINPAGQDGWNSIHRPSRNTIKDVGFSLYRGRSLMPDFNASTATKQPLPSLPLSRSYLGWLPGGCQFPGVKPSLMQPLVPGLMSCSYPYDPAMYNYLTSSLMTTGTVHNEPGR